jgi:membrane-associated phospholipid phosphatase
VGPRDPTARRGRREPPPHHPGRRHRLLRAAASAAALGLPFALLALLVRSRLAWVQALDEAAIRAATDLTRSEPALHRSLLVWQEAFRAGWVNLAVTAACLWVWRRHGLRTRALWAFTTLMVAWGLQLAAKQVVQRARPVVDDAVAQAPGYSFPSGHAANTAAACAVVTVLVWPLVRGRARVVVVAAAGAVVLVTAADRVLLGVHYPSDVVAGVLLGLAVTGASYAGYVGTTPSVSPAPPGPGG